MKGRSCVRVMFCFVNINMLQYFLCVEVYLFFKFYFEEEEHFQTKQSLYTTQGHLQKSLESFHFQSVDYRPGVLVLLASGQMLCVTSNHKTPVLPQTHPSSKSPLTWQMLLVLSCKLKESLIFISAAIGCQAYIWSL